MRAVISDHECVVVNDRAIRERTIQDKRLTSVVLGDGIQLVVGPNFREHPPREAGELGA
jgi:hypothetical protein